MLRSGRTIPVVRWSIRLLWRLRVWRPMPTSWTRPAHSSARSRAAQDLAALAQVQLGDLAYRQGDLAKAKSIYEPIQGEISRSTRGDQEVEDRLQSVKLDEAKAKTPPPVAVPAPPASCPRRSHSPAPNPGAVSQPVQPAQKPDAKPAAKAGAKPEAKPAGEARSKACGESRREACGQAGRSAETIGLGFGPFRGRVVEDFHVGVFAAGEDFGVSQGFAGGPVWALRSWAKTFSRADRLQRSRASQNSEDFRRGAAEDEVASGTPQEFGEVLQRHHAGRIQTVGVAHPEDEDPEMSGQSRIAGFGRAGVPRRRRTIPPRHGLGRSVGAGESHRRTPERLLRP